MKPKEIATKTEKELEALAADLQGKIIQARLDMGSRKTNDVKQIARFKKDLARTLTIQKAKQLEKSNE